MRRRLIRSAAASLAVFGLAAGAAWADATIYAAPPNQFVGGDVTIAQGEKVTFTNADTVTHDVTAAGKGAEGKPLFASAQIGPAQSAAVAGVEYLTTGTYEYICSIHPFMKGTITVSAAGTPAPRPGSGSGSEGPPPQSSQASADTVAPATSVKVLDSKRSAVRKRRSLQLAVKTDEAATLAITARAGKTTVATGSAKLTKAGTRKVTVKLTKAGLKLVKSSRNVRIAVAVDATDAAGNSSSASASGRLR
ncbi:MAG: plastocyanin/azurin family copper-binding protein [Thermoleophilaceae bacterium]